MKRKVLVVILAGLMILQSNNLLIAAEEELLSIEELNGTDLINEDFLTEEGEADFEEEKISEENSVVEEIFGSGKNLETAEVTIEGLDIVENSGNFQIQEEASDAKAGDVAISAENFPDKIFREYVEQFDTDKSGILEATEIEAVTEIEVDDKGITDLKGIEFFKSLTGLYCIGNRLSNLDVSGNLSLTDLFCGGNQLASLDVSGNPALITLNCAGNQMRSLDASDNPSLTTLICSDNQLINLDVKGSTVLTDLSCEDNQLSNLDVSGNPALAVFSCSNNQLSSLDVSSNLSLIYLYCSGNQLSNLDLSKNQDLEDLECDYNVLQALEPVQVDGIWQINLADYVGVDHLDRVTLVSEGASLSGGTVFFGSTKPTELAYKYDTKAPLLSENERQMYVSLEFSNNTTECDEHDMVTVVDQEADCGTPGIQHRECRNCDYREEPTEIPATGRHSFGDYVIIKEATTEEEGTKTRTCIICGETENVSIPRRETAKDVAVNEKNFPDEVFREYVGQFDADNSGVIEADEINDIIKIDVQDKEIEDLKGIEFFKSLTDLNCSGNELSSLDVSGNPALTNLDCSLNELSSLDVSSNPELVKLECCWNQLTSLDMSGNPSLIYLCCEMNNRLNNLNVRNNPDLTDLSCGANQLSNLDVSGNPVLARLSCGGNQLSSLDVSNNPLLTELYCIENQLSSLDVSGNPLLTELTCYENQLKNLDVSSNLSLSYLYCSENQLSSLDVSNNPVLILDCDNTFQVPAPIQMNGIWQMNLSDYVGADHLDRVTLVSEGASLSGGMVLFGSTRPTELIYQYDTKAPLLSESSRQMKVTLEFPDNTECDVHDMTTVVDQEPTCGTPGRQHRECRKCDYKEDPTGIPATGAHSIVTVVDQAPTCGTPGRQHRECRKCDYKEDPTEIPATGVHSFGAYVVTKAATVLEEGAQTRTCSVCGKTESTPLAKLAPQMTVSEEKVTLKAGQTTKLEVSSLAEGDSVASWESNNKKVVKVDGEGKLTAQKKAGTAVVTITLASGLKKEIQVTVQKAKVETKKISGLPKKVTLKKGKKLTLKPVITPADSQDKVTYKSSDKKVATVSGKGVVKGKKAGKAKITVTSGKKKVTVTVKVKK